MRSADRMKIRKTFLSVEIWRGLFSENGSERSPQTRRGRVGGGGGGVLATEEKPL